MSQLDEGNGTNANQAAGTAGWTMAPRPPSVGWSGGGTPTAPGPVPRSSPRRRLLHWSIALGTVTAMVAAWLVLTSVPTPIDGGARAAVQGYVDLIAEGRADEATALVPIAALDGAFANDAAMSGRTAPPTDIRLSGPQFVSDHLLAFGDAAPGDEVVRVSYDVAGETFRQDLRVAPPSSDGGAWTVRDPLVVETSVQPTAFGDLAIGDAVLTVSGDTAMVAGAFTDASRIVIEPRTVALYPGTYELAGRYGDALDSSPVAVTAAPREAVRPTPTAAPGAPAAPTGPDAGPVVTVLASPSATLGDDLQRLVEEGVRSCFRDGPVGVTMPSVIARNVCDTMLGDAGLTASTGLVGQTVTWRITPPTVTVDDSMTYTATGGSAIGSVVADDRLNGVTTTSEVAVDIDFDGLYEYSDGALVFWIDYGFA